MTYLVHCTVQSKVLKSQPNNYTQQFCTQTEVWLPGTRNISADWNLSVSSKWLSSAGGISPDESRSWREIHMETMDEVDKYLLTPRLLYNTHYW